MLQMLLQLFWKTFMVPCMEICTSQFSAEQLISKQTIGGKYEKDIMHQ